MLALAAVHGAGLSLSSVLHGVGERVPSAVHAAAPAQLLVAIERGISPVRR